MSTRLDEQPGKIDLKLKTIRPFENSADATGLWFATIMLFALLGAVLIVYRAANSDVRMASNDVLLRATQSDPAVHPPIVPR